MVKNSKYFTYMHFVIKYHLDDSCGCRVIAGFYERGDTASVEENIAVELSPMAEECHISRFCALSTVIDLFLHGIVVLIQRCPCTIGKQFRTSYWRSNCNMQTR